MPHFFFYIRGGDCLSGHRSSRVMLMLLEMPIRSVWTIKSHLFQEVACAGRDIGRLPVAIPEELSIARN